MSEVLEFIKTVGVPASIAFFVLWRLDKRLETLGNEIRNLAGVLAERVEQIERRLEEFK